MKNITLKQLRYFEALAEYKHFGKAAESVAISQPALSMQIRELEEALNEVLFERDAKQLRLSDFGEQFSFKVREILQKVEDLGEFTNIYGQGEIKRLRLGIIPTIAPYVLPSIISKLSKDFPSLELLIRETQTTRVVDELSYGKVDMGLVALPISEPSFTEVPIFSEEFLLVRPMKDKNQPVPSASDLHEHELLLLEEGHCFRDQALSFCNKNSLNVKKGLDGSSLTTLVQMAGAELGITLIPEMAKAIETQSANVLVDRFPHPKPKRTVGIVWRKTNPLSDAYQKISQSIHQIFSGT